MKKRLGFFIALLSMSAFINAASINEPSSNANAQVNQLSCEQRCQISYLYCTYGNWPVDCNAYYYSCLQSCPQ